MPGRYFKAPISTPSPSRGPWNFHMWQVYTYWNFWQNNILPYFSVTSCFFSPFSSENTSPVIWVEFWAISMFFSSSKFRKCICKSLKPYKLGLSSCEAENNFVVLHSSRRFYFARFHFIAYIFLKAIKGRGPQEGEGVEVGTLRYLPGTNFSL